MEVTLRFDRSILETVYDRFGEATEVKRLPDGLLEITVPILISSNFGWFAQCAEIINIGQFAVLTHPPIIIDLDKAHLR